MRRLRDGFADLRLGVRLVLGDRHLPWGRLALVAIGIGLGTAVLLAGVALPHAVRQQNERSLSREMPSAGGSASTGAAVLGETRHEDFYERSITGRALKPLRADPPLPPGVERMPGPGQLVVSPELKRVLDGPGGEGLLARLHGRVVGVIGPEGLLGERELYFYTGTAAPDEQLTKAVHHGFGEGERRSRALTGSFWTLLALVECAALVPVVVFVLSTARLAEAARQRRLAALRLIGADARQLRRIAVGENLVGAVLGLPVGWAVFLALRSLGTALPPLDEIFQARDLMPVWWQAVLVTLAVPVLVAVIAAVALRRAVVDPLGVAQERAPARRRLWWRLLVPAVGLGGLVLLRVSGSSTSALRGLVLNCSIVLFLLGVPLLLPWLLQVVGRAGSAGPVAWQWAVRRLGVVSGAAARSVSAIAVVIAGVVALQTFVGTELAVRGPQAGSRDLHVMGTDRVDAPGEPRQAVAAGVAGLPGVRSARASEMFTVQVESRALGVEVLDCPTIVREIGVRSCRDGDAFRPPPAAPDVVGPLAPGTAASLSRIAGGPPWWRIPDARPVERGSQAETRADLIVTPAAAAEVPRQLRHVEMRVSVAPDAPPELIEQVRGVAAQWLTDSRTSPVSGAAEEAFPVEVRYGALVTGVLVALLVGSSLLVNAVEQIQESARPLAVLGAVGVRRSTVMWSVFLQNAVPLVLALVVAVPCGVVLGAMLGHVPARPLWVDPAGLGLVAGSVGVLALVITALVAPVVSRALHPGGLRTG